MFKSIYDKAVDKATASTLSEQDWQLSIVVLDLINNNSKEGPKTAQDILSPIKRRFADKRMQVKYLSLNLIDTVVKNCGDKGFNAIFGTDFVSEICASLSEYKDLNYQKKVLELMSLWHLSFINIKRPFAPSWLIKLVKNYNILSECGYSFPEISKNEIISHNYGPKDIPNTATNTNLNAAATELLSQQENMTEEEIMKAIEKSEIEDQRSKNKKYQENQIIKKEEDDLELALKLSLQDNKSQTKGIIKNNKTQGFSYPDISSLNLNDNSDSTKFIQTNYDSEKSQQNTKKFRRNQ